MTDSINGAYGPDNTYAIYLYPKRGGHDLNPEDFATAKRRLTRRLQEAGYSEFKIINGGALPGGWWAMECHFRGRKEEIYPDLPDDLVNPEVTS